jgi:CheY-like chemotaxis protein
MGHKVTAATSTTQALETPSLILCDVLISDLRFPDGDGLELLRTIRLSRPIYAIEITGLGMPADRARSSTAGFHHHLLKPFTLDSFNAAFENDAIREVTALAAGGP